MKLKKNQEQNQGEYQKELLVEIQFNIHEKNHWEIKEDFSKKLERNLFKNARK